MLGSPTSASWGMPRLTEAIVRPSFSTAVASLLAAVMPPPPGWFCTTMFGWPGMNRGM